MLKVFDSFKLDDNTIFFCKNDDFDNMSKSKVKDYMAKIHKINIHDKNNNLKELSIDKYDVMSSLSDKISVAFSVKENIDPDNVMIPSEVFIIS